MDPLSGAVQRKEQQNRSIHQFIRVLHEMAESAANSMETITVVEAPVPDVQSWQGTLDKVCRDVECNRTHDHPRDIKITCYVSLDLGSPKLKLDTERQG